jgi:nucleoside-diphosphate-sugar epimerase
LKGIFMRVFVTGASGFVGSAVVEDLIAAHHQVLGLARSDASSAKVASLGAEVQRGDLDDLEGLRRAAGSCDGVIHTAFIHDFANFAAAAQSDVDAIQALGEELAGSQRPFVVTSGTALVAPGRVVTEKDVPDPALLTAWPRRSEEVAATFVGRGVRAAMVRLPPSVHGHGDHGFVPMLIAIAREKGVSAYVGDGSNRWPAVHRLDAASVFRLAVEKGAAGSRFHALGDDGIAFREIAGVIGAQLGLPVVSKSAEEAAEHFGWLARFAAIDAPASSALTEQWLGWHPIHVGLLEDLEQDHYFADGRLRV